MIELEDLDALEIWASLLKHLFEEEPSKFFRILALVIIALKKEDSFDWALDLIRGERR